MAQCAGQTRFRGRHAFSALQAAVENRRRRRRRPGGRSDRDFLKPRQRPCRRSGEAPGSGDRRTRRAPSARQPRPAAGPVRSVHAAAVPGAVRRARPVAGTGTPGRSRPPPTAGPRAAARRAEGAGSGEGTPGLGRSRRGPCPLRSGRTRQGRSGPAARPPQASATGGRRRGRAARESLRGPGTTSGADRGSSLATAGACAPSPGPPASEAGKAGSRLHPALTLTPASERSDVQIGRAHV